MVHLTIFWMGARAGKFGALSARCGTGHCAARAVRITWCPAVLGVAG